MQIHITKFIFLRLYVTVPIFICCPTGIIFNDSNEYGSQRRYVHRTLKDFGFGKVSLENILLAEADEIVEYFDSLKGKPVQPGLIFNVGVLNILWKIVADKR